MASKEERTIETREKLVKLIQEDIQLKVAKDIGCT